MEESKIKLIRSKSNRC